MQHAVSTRLDESLGVTLTQLIDARLEQSYTCVMRVMSSHQDIPIFAAASFLVSLRTEAMADNCAARGLDLPDSQW